QRAAEDLLVGPNPLFEPPAVDAQRNLVVADWQDLQGRLQQRKREQERLTQLAGAYGYAQHLHQTEDSPATHGGNFVGSMVAPLMSEATRVPGRDAWETAQAVVDQQNMGTYHPMLNPLEPGGHAWNDWVYENRWRIGVDAALAFASFLPAGEAGGI